MDDKYLRQQIIDELDFDPAVHSADIGVAVDHGVVTLTGHVPNFAQKSAAEAAVKRVKGVRGIAQDIQVRLSEPNPYSDEDIVDRAVTVLDLNLWVPKNLIQVKCDHGWVTLTGEVDWQYQKAAAEEDIRKLRGVVGLSNNVKVKPRVFAGDIARRIEDALKRRAQIEANGIEVSVLDGTVKLTGHVQSWRDRDIAERAAWNAPGVKAVEDQLRVA